MGFNDLNKPKKTNGANNVQIQGPTSTFGEVSVTNAVPIAQGDFVYGINSQIFSTSAFSGGTVTHASGNVVLQSGTDPDGSATIQLRRRLEYRPGQGSLMRATALYGTPDAGSAQFIGAGSAECGYFIGYFSTAFGILHSERGQREIRRLDITTGAGTEDVTVTLDGNSIVVPVTGGGSPETTAYQLSIADYSQVGRGGWIADAISGSVYYIAARSNSLSTGSYSVAGTSIVGAYTRFLAGEAQTNTFIPQASFNIDKLDGTGPSGMTLDTTKGNVFEIGVQYLGYGNAKFAIEDPETGNLRPFHTIKNANSRTTTVLKNPNLSILATSANIGGTTSTALKTASMAGFTEGEIQKLDPKFARSFTFTNVSESSYVPLALLKTNRVYNGSSSWGEFDLLRVAASNEVNNKTLTIGFFLNPEVTGDVNFQNVDENDSIVSIAEMDPSNDNFLNPPVPFYEMVAGSAATVSEQIDSLKFVFGPGNIVAIGIKTTASINGQVSVNWFEQQ